MVRENQLPAQEVNSFCKCTSSDFNINLKTILYTKDFVHRDRNENRYFDRYDGSR